jgi:hypothetical protein
MRRRGGAGLARVQIRYGSSALLPGQQVDDSGGARVAAVQAEAKQEEQPRFLYSPYCSLRPAIFTASAHSAISAEIMAANSSGLVPRVPRLFNWSANLGSLMRGSRRFQASPLQASQRCLGAVTFKVG